MDLTEHLGSKRAAGRPLETTAILEALRNRRRRQLLCHLRQQGTATLDELVDALGFGAETATEIATPGIERTRTTLYHLDLPKLEELGVLAVDLDTASVELLAEPASLDEWLDLAVRTDFSQSAKRVDETPETGTDHARAEPPTADTAEIRVLVVDDDPAVTEIVQVYLESNYDELSVTTTGSVETATERLHAEPFDCIVSDLRMPVISGLDFLKVVRGEDPTVPFLLFTGHGSETVASEAVKHGVTGYVVKSDDSGQFDDLAQQIQAAVKTVRTTE